MCARPQAFKKEERILLFLSDANYIRASVVAHQVKNLPAMQETQEFAGSTPGSGRSPGRGKWQFTPVFLPEKSHGLEESGRYSPKGRKMSDTTEQLSTHTHTTICQAYIHLIFKRTICN